MVICTNCGKNIPDTAALCSTCGMSISASLSQPISEPPAYIPPQQSYMPPLSPQSGYMYPPPQPAQYYMPPQQTYYGQQQNVPPIYQQGPAINVTVVTNTSTSSKSNTPVIIEVILSIFGIYGVGWLMAGETTTGIILLVCSFLVYWPIMVVMAIFTIGICDFPVAIAAVVINAILLNGALNRKATQLTTIYTK